MKHRILSHRGDWINGSNQNSIKALVSSVENGFGVETDIRDFLGQLAIAHDPPRSLEACLDDFLIGARAAMRRDHPIIALNVKSDGLADLFKGMLHKFEGLDYFVFDMSIPDMRSYIECGIPCFTRISEIEEKPVLLDESVGVWLDSFYSDWFSASVISDILSSGKRVCVVSPELHGRSHFGVWSLIRTIWRHDNLLLCTDYPNEASLFFTSDH